MASKLKLPLIKNLEDLHPDSPRKSDLTPVINISRNLFSIGEKNPLSGSEVSSNNSPVKVLRKNASLLSEMGFCSNFQSNNAINQVNRQLMRRSSIGVSDFWSAQDKEKFLKDQGLWGTYKVLESRDNVIAITSERANRAPSLPHIMDFNTIKRTSLIKKSSQKSISSKKIKTQTKIIIKTPKCDSRVGMIDKILEKCSILALDTKKLKKSTEKFKIEFSEQFQHKHKGEISKSAKNP